MQGGRKSVRMEDSNAGISGPPPDKKFEGRSNLKGKAESQMRKAARGKNASDWQMNEMEYIENLQKQVALMETEVKLLKEREVDQKNKASGYETLLRDGIPLNEHFLALKNKYNNEKDALDKQRKIMEEEIAHLSERNDSRKKAIEIQKQDFQVLTRKFDQKKEEFLHQFKNLEQKLFSEQHTKVTELEEKKSVNNELQNLRTENAQTDRVLRQAKNFTGKKDKALKEMKEESKALYDDIEEQNKQIVQLTWEIDVWKRKLADKNLLKNQQLVNMDLKQQNAMAQININTATARIEDLNGQIKMANSQILDVLTDKRVVDVANADMELILQGKGQTEAEQKLALFEAEREQTNKLTYSLNFKTEDGSRMLEQLKEEEALAKDMLDAKINAEQESEVVDEDAGAMKTKRGQNRDDLIRMNIRQSQLTAANGRTETELQEIQASNETLLKTNAELEEKIAKLDQDITELVQRVDVNTLLKEVDQQDLALLAKNNFNMNVQFMQLMRNWEDVVKIEEK